MISKTANTLGHWAVWLAALFVTVGAPTLANCGELKYESRWRGEIEVVVDGLDTEWQESRTFVGDIKSAIGILNDGEYLYVHLATDQASVQRQVVGRGFIVWFDSTGGKSKNFGIRFPIGDQTGVRPDQVPARDGDGSRGRPDIGELVSSISSELEILGPDGQSQKLPRVAVTDIEVGLGLDRGRLIYELRIPLRSGSGQVFAVGSTPGETIGISLETPEFDIQDQSPRDGRGKGSTMGGGRRGGMGGGGVRPGGGRRPERPKPIEQYIKVKLAEAIESEPNEAAPSIDADQLSGN